MTGLVQRLRSVFSPDFDDLDEPIGGRGPPLRDRDPAGDDTFWQRERILQRGAEFPAGTVWVCQRCGALPPAPQRAHIDPDRELGGWEPRRPGDTISDGRTVAEPGPCPAASDGDEDE